MSAFHAESKHPVATENAGARATVHGVLRNGDLAYTAEYGGNGSDPSYQETSGAPVERDSPLGYHVGWFTIIFLNVGQMIGTGVFSTRTYFQFRLSITKTWTSRKIDMLLTQCLYSRHYIKVIGIRGFKPDILGYRPGYFRLGTGGLLGIGILFPKPIRRRSRVSRTGIPTTEIFLSYGVRGPVCALVIQ